MSAAQYFDLQASQPVSQPSAVPVDISSNSSTSTLSKLKQSTSVTNLKGEIKPVRVVLQEVMFTSRVPMSTWTFAFAVNDKLWISDLTTLYFGKRVELKKSIYRGKMFIPDRGGSLGIGITAYNSYGDVFNMNRDLHVSAHNTGNSGGSLIHNDEDWTQLLFKFQVHVEQ